MARFFCDAMLGRLARRLRLAGVDTAYERSIGDADLVRRAVAEDRIILTRDHRLVQRRGAESALLLSSDDVDEQWSEVVDLYPSVLRGAPFTRCAVCNTPLAATDPAAVRDRVPPYVAATQDRFRTCPRCRRIYWSGTHVARIRRILDS